MIGDEDEKFGLEGLSENLDFSPRSNAEIAGSVEYGDRNWPILFATLIILANGFVGILQVLLTRFPHNPRLFGYLLPFGLFHWSRFLTLTLSFMLIYLSLRLYQRRKVAWWFAAVSSGIAAVTHLFQSRLWYTAAAPVVTCVILITFRKRFTVRTEPRSIANGVFLLMLSALIAIAYGTLGFWLLDRKDFGIEFNIFDALSRTLREFTLIGNSDLVARTGHARWFIESLRILGIVALSFATYSLFRPVAYRFASIPHERAHAGELVARSGRSSYDFFKTWPDKTYYFSRTGKSFIAYRAMMGVAICLGDSVGPDEELESITRSFLRFCVDNGWIVAFLLPDSIDMYRKLGFSVIKIAEGAVVDLERFCSVTAKKKYFRYIKRKLESEGNTVTRYTTPHHGPLLDEVGEISREWLTLPRHREFGFIQGSFRKEYLAGTPLTVLRDSTGRAVAFVNEVPSYRPGEATIDMMRHRPDLHWGAMDYLFRELMCTLKEEGFRTFYLGMAGITGKPGKTMVERAYYQISSHLNWLVHSKGVRQFKDKFDPEWEDRYLVYHGNPFSLAKIAIAVMRAL